MKHKLLLVFSLIVLIGLASASFVSADSFNRLDEEKGPRMFRFGFSQFRESWLEDKPECGLSDGSLHGSQEWLAWRERMQELRLSVIAERLQALYDQGVISENELEQGTESFSSPQMSSGSLRRMSRGFFSRSIGE